ncbi:iron hydrogenase small subunit [Anaerovoracaceae bacterium Sow4_D4]
MKSSPSIQENRIGFHHAVRRKERGTQRSGVRLQRTHHPRSGCKRTGQCEQPVPVDPESRIARSKGIYDTDINTQIKKSNENPLVQSLYDGLFYFIISTIA